MLAEKNCSDTEAGWMNTKPHNPKSAPLKPCLTAFYLKGYPDD